MEDKRIDSVETSECCCNKKQDSTDKSSEKKAAENTKANSSAQTVEVKTNCCSEKVEEATNGCCYSEKKEAATDGCCYSEKKEAATDDCCHCSDNAHTQDEDCCHCSDSPHTQVDGCHCSKNLGEATSSCCSEKLKYITEHSCCNNHSQKQSVESAGCACCDLTPEYKKAGEPKKIDKSTVKNIVFLVVSLAALIAGFFNWHKISGGSGALMALYYVSPAWIAVILCGVPVFAGAIRSLKNKRLNASVLISVAMIASIALEITGFFVNMGGDGHSHSYVFAAGEIAFLMALGELLEELTVKKCRSGIQRLVGLIPTEANVITDGGIVKLPLEKVAIGDRVLVKQGDMVTVDGKVLMGQASVDQSSLTGEYLPVDVREGDSVFGGTMNKSGVIEVEVTKLQKDMTIAKMAELTIEAEGKKAPVSRLADKWAGIVVPMVFVTAIIVGLICGLATDIGTTQSIIRAITVLVVFCPCSLVLATPTAIAAGLGNSAKHGVLVKSGASLEELSRIDTVCLDKTGTLTEGKIELQNVFTLNIDKTELLKYAAAVEKYSEHPLAVAVCNKFDGESYSAEKVESLQGIGVYGEVNGKKVGVVSYRNAVAQNVGLSGMQTDVDNAVSVGKTVAIVIIDGKAEGALAFSDTVRANASEVMKELAARGYKTIMLTGDNERSAKYIADKCNINEAKFDLMPEDKLSAIEELQKSGRKVCMVGDGINDAPSLKLANCSFAMGAMGSDIAIETADMAILNSDIAKVADTMSLAKRVLRTIKRNIIIAMTISVLAVAFSALGWLTPVTGALVHNGTSVLVVASSALLLYSRKKQKLAERLQ